MENDTTRSWGTVLWCWDVKDLRLPTPSTDLTPSSSPAPVSRRRSKSAIAVRELFCLMPSARRAGFRCGQWNPLERLSHAYRGILPSPPSRRSGHQVALSTGEHSPVPAVASATLPGCHPDLAPRPRLGKVSARQGQRPPQPRAVNAQIGLSRYLVLDDLETRSAPTFLVRPAGLGNGAPKDTPLGPVPPEIPLAS